MNASRRAFRPSESHALESRTVLSTMVPWHSVPAIREVHVGPVSQPTATVTVAGSSQSESLAHSGRPRHDQLTFSAHEVGAAKAGVATIKVDYHNESKTTITSATISEKLAPDLTYVPGVGHTPPGGSVSVESTSSGGHDVELNLPGGIVPGSEGYLEFQVKASAS